MAVLRTLRDGYECAAASNGDGWVAAALVRPDIDSDFIERFSERGEAVFKDGATREAWTDALLALRRKVVAFCSEHDEPHVLTEADRIGGVAVCGAPSPGVVWTERVDGEWRLCLWAGEDTQTLLTGTDPLLAPACAADDDGVTIACETIRDGKEITLVLNGDGTLCHEVPGRRPTLVPGLLTVERVNGPESVTMHAMRLDGCGLGDEIALPPANDFNMNAHACLAPATGAVYVAHEACAAWGYDERIGLHRDVVLWRLDPGADAFVPADGTGNGRVPLPLESFFDRSAQNYTTFAPRVVIHDGRPAVAYRRFRLMGHKSHSWDVCLTRFDGVRWADPVVASENIGQPDGAYALVDVADTLTGFFPACESMPLNTFADIERRTKELGAGVFAKDVRFLREGYERQAKEQRIEVVAIDPANAPAPPQAPAGYPGAYAITPGMRNMAPEPEGLPQSPDGYRLIWGDLHPHSAYSKCMGANDGIPLDVIRMQRDVLGCRVLCLMEHTASCRAPEFSHVQDLLELECEGRCVPLFGMESGGGKAAQHVNFYAKTRDLFDRLRALPHVTADEIEMYALIHKEFGKHEILPTRHMHGAVNTEFGIGSPRNVELYDPDLDVVMESMQTRGNMMMPGEKRQYGGPDFPSQFLNAGAKVGLVGGSDHSRGGGPNHFCLTGFWVKEFSIDGVWDAMINRRTFALSNGKVAMHATLNGQPMGSEVTVDGPVRITAHLACGHTILRAALIKDGELLPWQDIAANTATVELVDKNPGPGAHWYSVTVQALSAYYWGLTLGHASPFFVTVA